MKLDFPTLVQKLDLSDLKNLMKIEKLRGVNCIFAARSTCLVLPFQIQRSGLSKDISSSYNNELRKIPYSPATHPTPSPIHHMGIASSLQVGQVQVL